MNETINYIIRFLLGVDRSGAYSSLIGYTSNEYQFNRYKVVIIPSDFFSSSIYGTPESLPQLPLKEIEGVPLLFGSPIVEYYDETLLVHADIIASSFFLLSRYEEIQKREIRDEHGRFPGKESIPYKAGFINRPIIEEYGQLLRQWLRETGIHIPEPAQEIQKIWLTHDVDEPFFCRSVRNVLRESLKGIGFLKALRYFQGSLKNDPYYTFPWIFKEENKVKEILKDKCETLLFLKAGGKHKNDRPHYHFWEKDVRSLLSLIKKNNVLIGLHASYEAGIYPDLISSEKSNLEHLWKVGDIYMNRNHYLNAREPEDLRMLVKAGITNDFTMGYADVCGFRLGTCRPTKWINPITRQVSSLTLHPLSIMDCTLDESKYMGLTENEATEYCLDILNKIKLHGGEVVWLWHNTSFSELKNDNYHKRLYTRLLKGLTE